MRIKLATTLIAVSSVFLVAVTGCTDEDVGVPCKMTEVTSTNPGSGNNVRINTQALDCRSRLCIKYNSTARALCTEPCDTADDCPDSTETCGGGYACVIGQAVEGGGLSCCKMCVCKEFLSNPEVDPQAAQCKGKPSICPEI